MGDRGLVAGLITVGVVGGLGLVVYMGLITLLRVEEMGLLRELVRQRLGRSNLD